MTKVDAIFFALRRFIACSSFFAQVAIFAVLFFVANPLVSQSLAFTQSLRIPDSAEIRGALVETWFEAPLSEVRLNSPEVRVTNGGEQFQIRMEESETTFSIIVAPRASLSVDVYTGAEKRTVVQAVYPQDAQGSWVLVRDKHTGNPRAIRYYVAADSGVYVQFTPFREHAAGDFIILGAYAARQIPTGVPFERFYALSFADVMHLTRYTLPWQYVEHYVDRYDASLYMIQKIREKLSNLVYAEDAMYDEQGNPVYVTTGLPRPMHVTDAGKLSLSSAGFVKWIADGIVYPLTGGALLRAPLLVQTASFDAIGHQGIMQEKYSTSFALDWTRNIAAAILSVYTGRTYLYAQSGIDMTAEPFTAQLTAEGIKNTAGYVKNSGYDALALPSLMYAFASEYPGECYFAAIRETDRTKSPEVQFFSQCAIIFPYFDSNGRFQCVVFRNGAEYSLADFCRTFYGSFVHLTRVRTTKNFDPQ
ncbi:MAG: hypothetical protein IJR50_00270 [Treponema sp.]|nr:hypothetical protein [Treponema sp.]